MTPTTDALEQWKAQHAQIDFLFDHVAMLRDPDALSELADTLTAHLGAEQELLYPALASVLRDEVLDELYAEHAEIKKTLANLVWFGVEDAEFDARLTHLGELLDGHVGYQEETLFATARPFLHGRALPLAS